MTQVVCGGQDQFPRIEYAPQYADRRFGVPELRDAAVGNRARWASAILFGWYGCIRVAWLHMPCRWTNVQLTVLVRNAGLIPGVGCHDMKL